MMKYIGDCVLKIARNHHLAVGLLIFFEIVATLLLIPFNSISIAVVDFLMWHSRLVTDLQMLKNYSPHVPLRLDPHIRFVGEWYTSAIMLNMLSLLVAFFHLLARNEAHRMERVVMVFLGALAATTCFWFFASFSQIDFSWVVLGTIIIYVALDLTGFVSTWSQDELLRYWIPLFGLEVPSLFVVGLELFTRPAQNAQPLDHNYVLISAGALMFTSIAYLFVVHLMIPVIEFRFTLKTSTGSSTV